ncbi:unnamed protein product [Clonostachys byssicola]|uniref:Protein kinase domain-containing protein n=1 Tax=Clonostachys byssicola TaxID=160290 RepID=A0A9N9UGS9_9HYPO|nr:unnamed protein product [Clonostachys byssicola]
MPRIQEISRDVYNEDYAEPIFIHDNVLSSEYEDENNSDDNEDSDEDNEMAIYETVTTCLELFSRFTGRADSPDTYAKSEDIMDKRPTDTVKFIGDMEGSFNLWIDYTGALAANVSRSLDVRLQGYTDIKGMCVELLQMLARNLEYLDKGDERGLNSLTNSELQNEAVKSIQEAVEELHFMASVIRRSSVRSQNYSLSSRFESDDDPYFENYVFLILSNTFPHARRSLCKQLGASIALRRKRLRWKIQHEEKLKTRQTPDQVNTSPEQATPVAQSQPSRPQPSLPRQVEPRVIPPSSIGTRSNLDPGMARRRLKERPPLSTVSMGSSVCLSGRKYPPKPHPLPDATDCACPYCARRLSTAKLANDPRFWDKHLDDDVQPYVCLSEECTSPLLFFVNMKEWVNHMNSVHSEQWTRMIHMSTWFCDTNHEDKQFNDLESFREHMRDPASHPGRPPPSDLQLDTLSRNKQKTLVREDKYSCPFCDCIPDALKPVIPTSEPNAIRDQLHKHIASHIKDLAVLSIPILTTTETPKSESDEAEDEEKNRRLQEGEEASYPSGYDEELRALRLSDYENPHPEERPSPGVHETQNTHWHDVGFIEWYESEKGRDNTIGLGNDAVLQDFTRVQHGGGVSQDLPSVPRGLGNLPGTVKAFPPPTLYSQCQEAYALDEINHRRYLPVDSIRKLTKRENIGSELKRKKKIPLGVSKLAVQTEQQSSKIFLTLLFFDNALDIKGLLKAGFTDKDLPLIKLNDTTLQSSSEKEKLFRTPKDWTEQNIDTFIEKQWVMIAPVFTNNGEHREFDTNVCLPFDNLDEKEHTNTNVIFKADIHKAHQIGFEDDAPSLSVALKEFGTGNYFNNERENLGRIRGLVNNKHITKTFGSFSQGSRNFMIFPWADGGDLDNFWKEKDAYKRSPELLIWSLEQMLGLAEGLQALHHEVNLRHDNLNPGNILHFLTGEGRGILKIAGFGISKIHNVDTFDTHTRAKSPSFEAPEAVSKEKRARSRKYDIWSLGCIYLEFAVWLIQDWNSILDFYEERKHKASANTFAHFYRDSNGQMEVQPKVNERIKSLKSNPQCGENSPLGDLLDLIDAHLLRVEVDDRLDAEGLRDRLAAIVKKAKPE